MSKNIVIYRDDGVGEFGFSCLLKFFQNESVRICNAHDVIAGDIFKNTDIFVMPGGADLPYCRKLNGTGNDNIKHYVENGGLYLGICAGAYYACEALQFHAGRHDEISGPRELALIDATAYGSLPDIAPYYDLTLKTAAATNISLQNNQTMKAFYHGGPAFRLQNGSVLIHACYADIAAKPPAIIEASVGKGRAVLTGVHLEVSAEDLPFHPLEEIGDEERLKILAATMAQPSSTHNYLRQLIGIKN